MRRRKPPPELPRIYVRPQLDRRQREASRAFVNATCRGDRHRPAPGSVDPLWLRLGMRAHITLQRAGWVVSNPLLSDCYDRHPETDPSLPGPGWLRELYRWRDGRDLCTLPRTRAAIEERLRPLREAEERQQRAGGALPQPQPKSAQAEMF